MAVKIGHASIDENGNIAGGTGGDQTGKEVCTRGWYNGSWTFLARAKDAAVAAKIADACEAGCANLNIGYDQHQRNTLLTQAKAVDFDLAKIDTPCECDCSAFVSVCVLAAGVDLPFSGNLPTTSNLKSRLGNTGAFEILTDSKYLSSDKYLRRGDILCRPGYHTVIVLEDGSAAGKGTSESSNSTSESSNSTSESSNSTSESGNSTSATVTYNVALPLLKKGSSGESVKALQILLKGLGYDLGDYGENRDGIDGEYGKATEEAVKLLQRALGLVVDGIVGPKTWAALLGVT